MNSIFFRDRIRTLTIDRQRAKQLAKLSFRSIAPFALAMAVSTAAHAQGQIDMSGAQTFMSSIKTFALYAGGAICFIGLIWAAIRIIGGNFQQAIPGLIGALFGAGVLGWGAGWIGSLTGQPQ